MSRTVLILGAGVTGLAAAWKLLQDAPGTRVMILEKDEVPGGLAKSISWHGYTLDLGPHRIYTEIPEIKAFFDSFCQEQLISVPRASRMFLQEKYIAYPINFLETFLALGIPTTARFLGSALSVLLNRNKSAAETYEAYMKGYYGAGLYQRIFQPFAQKVWGVSGENLAAETARVRLKGDSIWHALLDSLFSKEETYVSRFLYPRQGIGQIAEQFAQSITEWGGVFHYQTEALRIELKPGGGVSIFANQQGREANFEGDLLINTIPLPALIDATPALQSPALKDAARQLRFRPLVLVYMLYDKKLDVRDTWLYYPESHVPFTRVSVPDNFNPHQPFEGKTCLCVEFTCEKGDSTWLAEPHDLAARAQEIFLQSGLLRAPLADALAVRLEYGYPVYQYGYESARTRILHALASCGSILTTGRQGLFRHNNIDQSIQMGLLAADHLVHSPDSLADWYQQVSRFDSYRIID
ncbi:MAG: FAD-dependent oxidoreductase [bacterium]|jgi:protoporphyrinogen oxidase|nr:FAD-dependent oxidoreductase [bacterium]